VVQDDELIFNGHTCSHEVFDCPDNGPMRHVAAGVVVVAYDQDAGMNAARLLDEVV
jgi:hypothetical protein